jgi:hypothetical protein
MLTINDITNSLENFHDSLSEPKKYKSVTIQFFLYFYVLTCLFDLCRQFSVLTVLDQKKRASSVFAVLCF